jgi:hypothetical protein
MNTIALPCVIIHIIIEKIWIADIFKIVYKQTCLADHALKNEKKIFS